MEGPPARWPAGASYFGHGLLWRLVACSWWAGGREQRKRNEPGTAGGSKTAGWGRDCSPKLHDPRSAASPPQSACLHASSDWLNGCLVARNGCVALCGSSERNLPSLPNHGVAPPKQDKQRGARNGSRQWERTRDCFTRTVLDRDLAVFSPLLRAFFLAAARCKPPGRSRLRPTTAAAPWPVRFSGVVARVEDRAVWTERYLRAKYRHARCSAARHWDIGEPTDSRAQFPLRGRGGPSGAASRPAKWHLDGDLARPSPNQGAACRHVDQAFWVTLTKCSPLEPFSASRRPALHWPPEAWARTAVLRTPGARLLLFESPLSLVPASRRAPPARRMRVPDQEAGSSLGRGAEAPAIWHNIREI